jgi:transcriptional regulator with XRE-family HTH domain
MIERYSSLKTLKNEVLEERKKRNLTQIEFAKFAKVSPLVISQIETGTKVVSYNAMKKIADAINDDVYISLHASRTITLDEETYNKIKEESQKANMNINDYIKSKLIS